MLRILLAATFVLLSTVANAQQPSTTIPTTRPVPESVVTFVKEQSLPSNPVMVSHTVAVGQALPAEIVLTPVPGSASYAYAVVNQQRVIVDTMSRMVVQVIK
jgi:hypothetical protein